MNFVPGPTACKYSSLRYSNAMHAADDFEIVSTKPDTEQAVFHNKKTRESMILDGLAISSQYRVSDHEYVLITDRNNAFEEHLRFMYFRDNRMADQVDYSIDMTWGAFEEKSLGERSLNFTFAGERLLVLTVHKSATMFSGNTAQFSSYPGRPMSWLKPHYLAIHEFTS